MEWPDPGDVAAALAVPARLGGRCSVLPGGIAQELRQLAATVAR